MLTETAQRSLDLFLKDANQDVRKNLETSALHRHFENHSPLMEPGALCPYFFIVLRGKIRVYRASESGREITLYHVNQGESCSLTTWSVLNGHESLTMAMAVGDLELLMIEAATFRDWQLRHEFWQKHTFNILHQRLDQLVHNIDTLSFYTLESRLAAWLLKQCSSNNARIAKTHQQIADELGSSREVISRLLVRFRAQGWIDTMRGEILLLNTKSLELIAHPEF